MKRTFCLLMLGLLTPASVYASSKVSGWLELRTLSVEALTQLAESGESKRQQVRALLILADRALNQSVTVANDQLALAQSKLDVGSEEDEMAHVVRCQIEHRQGLSTAKSVCSRFTASDYVASSPFLQSFVHETLAYYYYREGELQKFLEQANATLRTAELLGDHGLLAKGNNLVGLHFTTRLLPRIALPHLEAAWDQANMVAYDELKPVVQLNLAANYTQLGREGEALNLLAELQGSPVISLYPSRLLVAQAIKTHAQAASGAAAQGESELRQVLEEVADVVLPDTLSYAYQSLGIAQLTLNRPEEALATFDKLLETVGRDLNSGLDHPRVQLMVVWYARALRLSGRMQEARTLLESVIASVPQKEPDQLLLDAYSEMAAVLQETADDKGAMRFRARTEQLREQLWDASFRYRFAQLNKSMEIDRILAEQARAGEREIALREMAEREATLKKQSWVIAAMLIALLILLQSRRLQKRLADSERVANDRLEQVVVQRTKALEGEMAERLRVEVEQRDLLIRLAEAEKLRALGQLTAGVAHDFNNLMTVVTLAAEYLQVIAGKENAERQDEMLRSIIEAAETGSQITDGLLAYVRKQPLQPEQLQLGAFLRNSLPLFKSTLGDRYFLETDIRPCSVSVDKGQLTTALMNLLLNAKEAMPDEGTLYLKLFEQDEQAQIVIRDTGAGMTEASLQRAVEPFYTTKTGGEGTGLGLSMVYGFARQSGGNLLIESKEGFGTTVKLTLPLATPEHEPEQTVVMPPAKIDQDMRVLVVDDRHSLLHMLTRTLEQLGLKVSVARSADHALELVQSAGMPDLLVTDIVMPGSMDGLGLANELRKQNPGLAIVLISGYTDDLQGDYVFLPKPFSMVQLEQSITDALDRMATINMPANLLR